MTTEKKPRKKASTSKVKFTVDNSKNSSALEQPINSTTMANALREQLQKSVKPQTIRKDLEKRIDKNKVAYSIREYENKLDGVEVKGWRRLGDAELKELSLTDPYISAIISTRCSQAAVIGRASESKFDKGTRIAEVASLNRDDFENEEDFEKELNVRQREMKAILKWFLTCGTSDIEIINTAYSGTPDRTFKFCSLGEFITAQVRNLLTFGRMGSQKFRDEDGTIFMFRPVPIETIYNIIPKNQVSLSATESQSPQSEEDVQAFNKLEDDERPMAYTQRIDGSSINFFTEDDLAVHHFQKQALFDLDGYMLSPVEMAIYMVFIHQQTLGYLRNQFVKGMATKGILTIEATDPAAQLSDEDVEAIRRDFHNFATRNDNASAVPVIAGPVKVGYVPLSQGPNDMGFLEIEKHVISSLCSAFQISSHEMGFGNLGQDSGGLTQGNQQSALVQGEERGLRMLLDTVYDCLNEILYANFPEARDKYRITFIGVGDENKEAAIQRQIQELQTTATMNSLWSDSEKTDTIPIGGDVPLAAAFHANIARYMKYGVFMEKFFGEEGASKVPEYDFLIDPNLNTAYQALKVQPLQMQQESAKLGIEQQEMQMQQVQAQMQQGQQQMAMAQQQAQQPQEAPQSSQGPSEGAPEEVEKSLHEEFSARRGLKKSVSSLFQEWIRAHD